MSPRRRPLLLLAALALAVACAAHQPVTGPGQRQATAPRAVVVPPAATAPDAEPAGDPEGRARVRIMAANTTSGNLQSYPTPGPGTRIFQALEPDIVLVQELNVNATRNEPNDDAAVRAWVDQVFGPDYHVFRENGGAQIPNGVVSRWPILEAGEWDDPEVGNRDFVFARIDVPGEIDLWAVSVHLLTRSSGARNDEAEALVARLLENVPEGDYLAVGGDFNTRNRNEPMIGTLGRVVDVLGPFPDDGGDPSEEGTSANRERPLDWVLADADLQAHAVPTVVGDLEFPSGLVFDSRIFSQEELDETFPPVLQSDSGAPMMQHMAVVRDFLIPVGPVEPTPGLFRAEPAAVDFGTVDASDGPVRDATVRLVVPGPMTLEAVSFDGSHPEELALAEPDLSAGPLRLESDTPLAFVWTPAGNDGVRRRVVATLIGDAEPGAVEVTLAGVPRAAPEPGTAFDLGGFRLLQTGGDASLVLPAATALPPGGLLVVGRAAGRAEFEAFWGALDPGVVYLNGEALAGSPGFPIVNGGERYRLVDSAGAAVDPPAGEVPAAGTDTRLSFERTSTGGSDFVARDQAEATPGRFAGERTGTGRPVVTEVSDAREFRFEFVEILFDAPAGGPGP